MEIYLILRIKTYMEHKSNSGEDGELDERHVVFGFLIVRIVPFILKLFLKFFIRAIVAKYVVNKKILQKHVGTVLITL